MQQQQLEQWLRLIHLKGLSLDQKRRLALHFGGPDPVFQQSRGALQSLLARLDAWHHRIADPLVMDCPALDLAIARDLEVLAHCDAGFLPITDAHFPTPLRHIDQPPLGLFYRGDPALLNRPQLAMVGSRHASRGGCETARQFAAELAVSGLLITSGLALGIDSSAHRGALDSGQPTVAVVATGIDRIYPHANRALHRRIVEEGIVVTEFAPTTAPRRAHFPQRNRIISGLAMATLVVEAGLRSGSLITARLASEQGREVFAIPGSIHTAGSRGCHFLIRQGAALVERPADVLQELALQSTHAMAGDGGQSQRTPELDQQQRQVFDILEAAPCPVDQIISHSGLTTDQVSSILVRLELLGLISESVGGYQKLP